MTGVAHLSAGEIRDLTFVDGVDHVAFGAEFIDESGLAGDGLGTARYVRSTADPTEAEFAVTVVDDHHRRGLATAMLDVLSDHARRNGIERFTAVMLAENRPIQELIRQRGGSVVPTDDPTIVEATIDLIPPRE
jgi:GNAT superfamily N-acetyltransferase